MVDFEKLGVFYLGREYDAGTGRSDQQRPILYDARDLVTHAVCVGMTGSGKTGLCLGLIEEAVLDGVPALILDPKGDLGNLLLTFPQLRPEDFLPWINADDARRQGQSPEEFAAGQAETWRRGLAAWGQTPERIQRLREAAEFAIYTPGSDAGLPLSVMASFAAPPPALREDGDLFRQRIGTTATSLLGLMGIDADPLRSREHILLSNLFLTAWTESRDLDLAQLIELVQKPPLQRVGVLDLEAFYPAKDRFELAMALNNLLASPTFQSWLQGDALDPRSLLYTAAGKPRVAIISIAHLADAERMFLVALLLNQTLGWVRSLSGTTSLRALIYMDEVFGFLPPVANPPSKLPLLTLLKQARAYGVGIVLATQNPVDLDYKALSNIGTWFLGRLQTERDQLRVLDGLEGAAAASASGLDRTRMGELLAGLKSRVFLLQNVHEDGPVLMESRWAMSYLRGPLTLQQIRTLMAAARAAKLAAAAPDPARPAVAAPASGASASAATGDRPVLPPEVPQVFLPAAGSQAGVVYEPALLGLARVHFGNAKLGVDATTALAWLAPLGGFAVDWQSAAAVDIGEGDLQREPAPGARFVDPPSAAGQSKSFAAWTKAFTDAAARGSELTLLKSPATGEVSRPGESEREFRVRLVEETRVERDRQMESLRAKQAPKLATLEERLRRAKQAVERERSQATNQKVSTAVAMGTTLLGALFGRKRLSSTTLTRASSAVRNVGRSSKESQDVDRAEDTVAAIEERIATLEAETEAAVQALTERADPRVEDFENLVLKPKRGDVEVRLVALAWVPEGEADRLRAAGAS